MLGYNTGFIRAEFIVKGAFLWYNGSTNKPRNGFISKLKLTAEVNGEPRIENMEKDVRNIFLRSLLEMIKDACQDETAEEKVMSCRQNI